MSRKRIGPVRQRNDESRDPTQWASDSAKARGSKGATLCTEPQILDLFIHDLEVRFNETPFFNPPSGGSTLPFRKGHSAG
ncbi:hypothetical protein, partial [Yersinia pseudotuberculosis]|uniref:hypothetical protein n=1 Tax=Yersinia pseudotuberculosis TaxID=633 RepID=UPI001C628898